MSKDKKKLHKAEANEPDKDVASLDSINDEMEELARIFREELGKAVQESEEAEETDLDDIEVEGYNPRAVSTEGVTAYTETLCECCGERPAGTDEDPDSPFCNECAALMEKYPYDWKGIVAFVLVLGVAIMSLALFAGYTPVFSRLSDGNKAKSQGKLYSAEGYYSELQNYLEEEGYDLNLRNFKRNYVEIEYQLGNNLTILDFISDNYDTNDISDNKVKSIYDDIINMQMTKAAIESHFENYKDFDDDDYDAIIKELESLLKQKIYYTKDDYTYDESLVKDGIYKLDGSEDVYVYNESWIRVYQYMTALAMGKKDDEIKYLKLAYDGGTAYVKAYIGDTLAQTYILYGKYEEAKKLSKDISATNKESISAYLINAMLFRYKDKNYRTALDTCINGLNSLTKVKNGSPLIASIGSALSMQKTLSYIMLKEYDNAYESAKECFSYQTEAFGQPQIQVRDLYAILAYATDDMDTYNSLVEQIENYKASDIDYSFEKDVDDFVNGKITLQEIASSGRYDKI